MQPIHWLCAFAISVSTAAGAEDQPQAPNQTDNSATVTYTKQIAPIIFKRCVTCHRPGEVGPFSLTSYDSTVKWAETIREAVSERRMPPWLASPKHGSFANEARLSDDELKTILGWIDGGTPEGVAADLPPLPVFVDGWRIPEPDLVLEMPKPFRIPATGTVNYQYFTIDPGFKEDMWVRAAEARPGNRSAVHHIVLLVQAPGDRSVQQTGGLGAELLATFAPGLPPTTFDNGLAKLVPAGSKLVLQVHYTPTGVEQSDQSRVGLIFAKPEEVRKRVRGAFALNFQFRIPPGADSHPVEANYKFSQDSMLVALFPHMHLRGKSFQFEARYPDGKTEILLDVPRWDFNWQNQYVLVEPKRMPEGTVLHCSARFDNSANNPANPDPDVPVAFGEQTWQEMMVGYFDATLADQDLVEGGPKAKELKPGEYETVFRYKPNEPVKTVHLAGSFNDWKPAALAMEGPDEQGYYNARLVLPPGKHEYKFVVDGTKWRQDPGNYRQVGSYNNSLLSLGGDPPAAPTAPAAPIDIQPQANQLIKEEFSGATEGNNLADLPDGARVLQDVSFKIGPKMIALGNKIKTDRPMVAEGIRVDKSAKVLHILHATEFGEAPANSDRHVPDGTEIGSYTIRYEDNTTETVPVVYGVDVRDWWFNAATKGIDRGKIAWVGSNDLANQLGAKIRLYLTSWKNPKPNVRITTIDFRSNDTAAAPFCVAISAQ